MAGSSGKFTSFKFLSSDTTENVDTGDEPAEVSCEKDDGYKYFNNFVNKVLDVDNLLVIAGSGTSLSFNGAGQTIAPSMWHLWDYCEKNDPDVFQQVMELVKYNEANIGNQAKDIELLLSLCDSHIAISSLGGSDLQLVKDFLSTSKNTILEKTNFTNQVTSQNWAAHNKFLRTAAIRGPKQQRLKLFTTNYDLAFEYAASNTGLITIDGFEFSEPSYFNPMWFGYDVVKRSAENQSTFLSNVFQLYKIHGSVNWRRNENGRVIKDFDEGEPVFIYPSTTKYQSSYDSPYIDMISAFLNAIQQPNTAILCLGFGFNDKHINNALSMALRTNPELIMLVATKDPFNDGINPEIRDLLREAIKQGDGRIAIMDSTFDVFTEHLPDRRSKSPEESLLESFENISKKLKIDDAL